jgi:Fe-S-cluster-containing hydrogenase component 2
MKVFYINPEKCTGCRLCEMACSFNKHGKFNRELSNIRIETEEDKALNVPIKCMQCEDTPCARACVTQAIYRNDETGAMVIDYDKCIGCKACMVACPFGCINIIHAKEGTRVAVCDLCSGDPSCVKVCREGALQYIEEEKTPREKRKETFKKLIGDEQWR